MNDYDMHPEHPLRNVPQEILDAARSVLDECVAWKEVERYMAHPIADAVVVALLPWLSPFPMGTTETDVI